MKAKHLSVVLLLWVLAAGAAIRAAEAQDRGAGVGIVLGEPTGFCGKLWLGPTRAVDAAMAWSFLAGGSLYVHGDYLLHFPLQLASRSDPADPILAGRLVFWTGVGGRLRFMDGTRLGVRLPMGLSWLFPRLPMDTFLEITPGIDLYPETSFALSASIGLRLFFPRRPPSLPPTATTDSI